MLGQPKIIQALIAKGADINHIDDEGITPLMVAKQRNGWVAQWMERIGAKEAKDLQNKGDAIQTTSSTWSDFWKHLFNFE